MPSQMLWLQRLMNLRRSSKPNLRHVLTTDQLECVALKSRSLYRDAKCLGRSLSLRVDQGVCHLPSASYDCLRNKDSLDQLAARKWLAHPQPANAWSKCSWSSVA